MAEQSDGGSDAKPSGPFESVDLRAAIAATLAALPIDDMVLRAHVWNLVATQRDRGASPAQVIVALSNLVDDAVVFPVHMRQALVRRIILWTVEAYFGHLGGEVYAGEGPASRATALDPTSLWRQQQPTVSP